MVSTTSLQTLRKPSGAEAWASQQFHFYKNLIVQEIDLLLRAASSMSRQPENAQTNPLSLEPLRKA